MKKKELKTLNLDDLELQGPVTDNHELESLAEVKVDIQELSSKSPQVTSNLTTLSKKVEGDIVKPISDVADLKKRSRFKLYEGSGSKKSLVNFMSSKHRFDKKQYVVSHLIIFVIAVAIVLIHKLYPDDIKSLLELMMLMKGSSFLALFIKVYLKIYPVIILIFLYFFPLKRNSPHMVEVYFDGLTVPNEIITLGMSQRVRVKWKDIDHIYYKNELGIPFVQIFDKKKYLLGEIRLDLTDMKGFYHALNTYCPEENALRNLFTNVNNS